MNLNVVENDEMIVAHIEAFLGFRIKFVEFLEENGINYVAIFNGFVRYFVYPYQYIANVVC